MIQNIFDLGYTGTSALALGAAADSPLTKQGRITLKAHLRRSFIKKRAVKSGMKVRAGSRSFIRRRPGMLVLPVEAAVFGNTRDLTDEDLAGFDLGV